MTDWTDIAAAEINNALQLGLSDSEMRRVAKIVARNAKRVPSTERPFFECPGCGADLAIEKCRCKEATLAEGERDG